MSDLFQHELALEGQNYRLRSEYARNLDRCFGASEDEYVRKVILSRLEALERELSECGDDGGISADQAAALKRQMDGLRANPGTLDLLSLPQEFVREVKSHRLDMIRQAVRDGIVPPRQVLEEYPAKSFERELGSMPGGNTAALLVTTDMRAKMDASLLGEYGVRLRRQDGRQDEGWEREQVAAGLRAIFEVLGDLSVLLRASGLTISHTGGKRLFRQGRTALGLYRRESQAIVVGPVIAGCGGPVEALVHELAGHWLDAVSTPPQEVLDELFDPHNPFYRSAINTSFVDAMLDPSGSLYPGLIETMTLAGPGTRRRQCPPLSTSELWARLAEQYIVERVGEAVPGMILDREAYRSGAGFWCGELWARGLGGLVSEQIERRIAMVETIYGIQRTTGDQSRRVLVWPTWMGSSRMDLPICKDGSFS